MRPARLAGLAALSLGAACGTPAERDSARTAAVPDRTLHATDTTLVIPQVDYEAAIYRTPGDPHPHLDLARVDPARVVRRERRAVILENEYVRLTVLPEMGRIYALVFKPTGHDVLWRNDTVTVGGGNNRNGWWIWIGGIENTLPGDEHGTTWAVPWRWSLLEDTPARTTVRMEVTEPGSGLEETLDVSLVPGRADFALAVTIRNPTTRTVRFAHWINPQWAPGGRNELTDDTEFVIPTESILIAPNWQRNMGPSPQAWAGNRYRFIRGWARMGDLMADGVRHGFYGAYSHDEDEGVVRVFDPRATPGVDVWTYGFHPTGIPMGSGAPSRGYVEMWGGTSRVYASETRPLAPGDSVAWTEWMYPFRGTRGLTFAERDLAVNFAVDRARGCGIVAATSSRAWRGEAELVEEGEAGRPRRVLERWPLDLTPARAFVREVDIREAAPDDVGRLRLRVRPEGGGAAVYLPPELRSLGPGGRPSEVRAGATGPPAASSRQAPPAADAGARRRWSCAGG